MTFALYNTEFEAVVSGDDGSFIAVWDIETGKLMSKFGDAHGVCRRILEKTLTDINIYRELKSQLDASIPLRGG